MSPTRPHRCAHPGFAEPEIGHLVRAWHRGQGYAAVMLHECRAAGLTRVWAGIRPHHTASRRITARLGMRVALTNTDDRGALQSWVIDLNPAG